MPVTPVKRKSMKGDERKGVVRYLWLAAGAVSFGLGTAGTVLPLLPTVPFYMVTLFCLARGSERFHRKFLHSSLYRKTVGAYEKDKSLTLRAKTAILLSVSAVMGTGAYFSRHILPAVAVIAVVWTAHVIALVCIVKTKKTGRGYPAE